MFAFDGLFTDEDAQSEVAASALTEAIHGVISGIDSCLFAFGHASLGKTLILCPIQPIYFLLLNGEISND